MSGGSVSPTEQCFLLRSTAELAIAHGSGPHPNRPMMFGNHDFMEVGKPTQYIDECHVEPVQFQPVCESGEELESALLRQFTARWLGLTQNLPDPPGKDTLKIIGFTLISTSTGED